MGVVDLGQLLVELGAPLWVILVVVILVALVKIARLKIKITIGEGPKQ
ncbi:hypothetical protein ACFOWE_29140 [Planomonospora corallina]|uniref:Uncharacterized protein n=1 Tax=Planomonospora corallina TaxID=1806052 RepID=A0ABV8IKP3_9ACTN